MKFSKLCLISLTMLVSFGLAYYISNSQQLKPIKIVDYGSLECPDSSDFYIENGELLKELYADNKITYIFKPLDLIDFDNDKYIYEHMTDKHLEFNNIVSIFQNQSKWSKLGDLKDISNYLKLNNTPIKENIELIKQTKEVVKELNASSYPAIYINGELIEYTIKKEELSKLISEKLTNSTKKPFSF